MFGGRAAVLLLSLETKGTDRETNTVVVDRKLRSMANAKHMLLRVCEHLHGTLLIGFRLYAYMRFRQEATAWFTALPWAATALWTQLQ